MEQQHNLPSPPAYNLVQSQETSPEQQASPEGFLAPCTSSMPSMAVICAVGGAQHELQLGSLSPQLLDRRDGQVEGEQGGSGRGGVDRTSQHRLHAYQSYLQSDSAQQPVCSSSHEPPRYLQLSRAPPKAHPRSHRKHESQLPGDSRGGAGERDRGGSWNMYGEWQPRVAAAALPAGHTGLARQQLSAREEAQLQRLEQRVRVLPEETAALLMQNQRFVQADGVAAVLMRPGLGGNVSRSLLPLAGGSQSGAFGLTGAPAPVLQRHLLEALPAAS